MNTAKQAQPRVALLGSDIEQIIWIFPTIHPITRPINSLTKLLTSYFAHGADPSQSYVCPQISAQEQLVRIFSSALQRPSHCRPVKLVYHHVAHNSPKQHSWC